MESSMPKARATGTESEATTATSGHTLGLAQIPLEIRTEIYDKSIDSLTELIIPESFNGSALSYLSQQLPRNLTLNHQIRSEAAAAYFKRSMLSVEKIIAPDPEMLLADAPPTLLFMNLRHLEFTRKQGHLTPRSGSADPTTVYDLTSRCPKLQVLKMPVTDQMLYIIDASSGVKRNKTMEEIDAGMKFTNLLEQGKELHTILLTYPTMAQSVGYQGRQNNPQFDEFATWFWNECVKRGREIDFAVEVGPQEPRARKNPELVWYTQGHVKTAWYFDFFG